MAENSSAEHPRKSVKLGDQGPKLPIGHVAGGSLVKDLAVRAWKTRDERELGKLKKEGMGMGQYVSLVVAYMCSKFGGHDWSAITGDSKEVARALDERRIHLGRFTMGDVFYAYMYLRRDVLGNELKMNVKCPQCAHAWVFVGDLDTVEVVTVDAPEALRWTYKLHTPIQLRQKQVTHFQMGAPLWTVVESAGGSPNNEVVPKIAALRGSITALNDDAEPVILTDMELDELSKRDFETLMSMIDKNFVGPKMAVDGECPKCEAKFFAPINWKYDDFFAISSF